MRWLLGLQPGVTWGEGGSECSLKKMPSILRTPLSPISAPGIVGAAAPYTGIKIRCSLFIHGKLAILMYPNQSELINKGSKLQ